MADQLIDGAGQAREVQLGYAEIFNEQFQIFYDQATFNLDRRSAKPEIRKMTDGNSSGNLHAQLETIIGGILEAHFFDEQRVSRV